MKCVCVYAIPVQSPHVGRAMHEILHRAQKMTGYWVGSSVIHLGDHNVPNRCTARSRRARVSVSLFDCSLPLFVLVGAPLLQPHVH